MELTKKGYLENIQPMIDKITDRVKNDVFSLDEKCLIESALERILSHQIDPKKLFETLNSLTKLQLQIAAKYEFEADINKAKAYLKDCLE